MSVTWTKKFTPNGKAAEAETPAKAPAPEKGGAKKSAAKADAANEGADENKGAKNKGAETKKD